MPRRVQPRMQPRSQHQTENMLSPTEQMNALRYSPFHRLVYVKNQKAACTSIEYSLWTDKDRKTGRRTFWGRTHDKRSPLLGGASAWRDVDADSLHDVEVFTVVRNPFSRILSAYLHHVYDENLRSRLSRRLGLWRSKDIRRQFFQAVGMDPKRSLGFGEFVERLVEAPHERLTGHFRPQVTNVLWGELVYDFLGRLEEPDLLDPFFARHEVAFKKRAPHAQSAGEKMNRFYTARTVELIAAHFAQDFQAFGYDSSDPASTALQALQDPPAGMSLVELLAASCNG